MSTSTRCVPPPARDKWRAVPRPAPDRAIVRLRQRIDRGRGSPVIALECRESHGAGHEAGVEYKETGIGTDEVAVTAGIQKDLTRADSDRGRGQGAATWPSNRTSPSAVQNQTNPRGSLRTHACWSRGRPSAVVKVRTGRSADSGDTMATATTTMVSAIRKPSRHSLITAGPGCWILGLLPVYSGGPGDYLSKRNCTWLPARYTRQDRGQPVDDILRFPSAVKHDPAIDAWVGAQRQDLTLVEAWFMRMRQRGGDVRELMHDGCPTACVGDAAFGYVNA